MRDISIFMEGRASRTPGSRRHVVEAGSVDVNAFGLRAPSFLLAYATVDFPLPKLLEDLRRTFPSTPIFGCTSYEGVFSREGFFRGAALLAGEQGDNLHVSALARRATAYDAREKAGAACRELVASLYGKPRLILMHATPGFEEREAGVFSLAPPSSSRALCWRPSPLPKTFTEASWVAFCPRPTLGA